MLKSLFEKIRKSKNFFVSLQVNLDFLIADFWAGWSILPEA
jgi:hypothetical protein